MTPRQEADEAVLEFAALIAQRDQETSGHRKPPTVTVTESVMDPQPFDLEIDPQTLSSASGRRGGGTPPPVTPCCSTPTLVCDSISASLSKCGFTEYVSPSTPPKYYLVEQSDFFRTTDLSCRNSNPLLTCLAQDACARHRTITYDSDDCTTSQIGGLSPSDAGNSCVSTECNGDVTDPSGNCFTPTEVTVDAVGTKTQTTISYDSASDVSEPGCTPSSAHIHEWATKVLSSEYTTALLIAATEAALPSYPETWDGSCSASRDLSDDETTYSIQRFKYKFTWADPLPADCKISWIERTYDSDGNPVSDTPMSETVSAGSTESTVYEVMEPAANGTVGVVFPIGACCTGGVCSTTDATTCTDGGGTFHSSCKADPCSPNPC